jgi:competence protein ComEC
VLNILVSVILTVLVAVSLMALLVSLLSSSLALPLVHCANGINWLMVHSVDPFSRLGVASLRLPEYSGWARSIYVLYFLPLLALGFALHNWEPLALPKTSKLKRKINVDACLVAQAVLVLVIVLHPLSAPRADGKLHLDFLDVGQGDSILVTTPDGTTLLVDGGGRPNFLNRSSTTRDDTTEGFERETRSIGESVVSEYLWGRGLSTVDFVLATHADADHIDGLNDVVQNFFVRSALVGRTPMNDGEYARFAQTLSVTRTPVNVIQGGDKLTMGGLEIEVLWPPPLADPHATSRNNDSVVLRLNFGRRKILLTGDIEKQSENSLVNSSGSLQSDVVKVPHHGSRTSSTEAFVTATRASVAIISVGQTSMFGHPHREVLERWQAHNVDVLTTGKCGTIAVTSDGDTVWISTFLSRNQ